MQDTFNKYSEDSEVTEEDTSKSILKMQDSIFKILLEVTFWKILLHLSAHLHVCILYIMLL